MAKLIGISQRITQAQNYDEPRDSLAQDWQAFIQFAMPEVQLVPIPNIGEGVSEFLDAVGLSSVILSGGDDIGKFPLRDETESKILKHSMARGIPIFGVCRGLQVIQNHFGGELSSCNPEIHVAKKHSVTLSSGQAMEVNSFHGMGVKIAQLAKDLQAFATSPDGFVEGLTHKSLPILAIQWHPERGRPFRDFDRDLMRSRLLGQS